MQLTQTEYASWNGELEARVAAFRAAVAAHAYTVGVPAPAEHGVVEQLAREGIETLVVVDDPPLPAPPQPANLLAPLAFRWRFTGQEMAAITLAASRGLEQGDATLQVWIDDLAAAREVDLADPRVGAGIAKLVELGLLTDTRGAAILALPE